MSKVRFIKYLHADKESNVELSAKFSNPEMLYVGYEEELLYEYDTETKETDLIGARGRMLSGETYDKKSILVASAL